MDEAAELAGKIGYPVVLKIESAKIPHKSDVGGVVLDIENEDILRASYDRMMERVKTNAPDIEIDGCTVQKCLM